MILAPEVLTLKPLNLRFEEKGHKHFLNDRKVPGATTISGVLQKDWMGPWCVAEMEKYVIEQIEGQFKAYPTQTDGTIPFHKIKELLKEGKAAYTKKRDKGADSGKVAHGIIETAIKLGASNIVIPDNTEVKNSVNLFLKWQKEIQPHWLASELQVASETHQVAAIIDSVFFDGFGLWIGEFKTSNDVYKKDRYGNYKQDANGDKVPYDEHRVQTAIQQICLEEMMAPLLAIAGRRIIHLPKTGDQYQDHVIKTPYTQDKTLALSALAFWKALNMNQEAAA